jgi:hypothetical protein
MVRELSQIEVDARRTKSFRVVDAKLGVINGAIVTLEQWIMMAELIR